MSVGGIGNIVGGFVQPRVNGGINSDGQSDFAAHNRRERFNHHGAKAGFQDVFGELVGGRDESGVFHQAQGPG